METQSKLDFSQEVRIESLTILWKVTLVIAAFLVWGSLILSALSGPTILQVLLPTACVAAGSLGANFLLNRNRYEAAVWSYIAGLTVALALLLTTPGDVTEADQLGRDMLMFGFPLLIILVGLLLPARSTVLMMGVCVAIVLVAPSLGRTFTVERSQVFAVVLMALAAGIAAQMSGGLYGIAEWALESYRKERKVKEQLFDSQNELQRSYMRQKALAEQLQETNAELEAARAAALEAKNFRGQFLANMSHELRTPLNAIIGFSETMLNFPMMYDNQELPEAYRNDMNQIFTSGKHLLQLINDILDLSKVDAGKLDLEIERVDLETVFKGALSTAVGLVGDKPIKLLRDYPANLPPVRGDSLRLRQVILNLLSNAAKFTDHGSVTLGARPQEDGTVLVWVQDTGIGISAQDMDKIWEEFRQGTSGRRKGRAGSGLGLAISRQLLNLMGGRIWAESTLGQGSKFSFTLPVYVEETVEAA
jgi:signal transduction histidine kinase